MELLWNGYYGDSAYTFAVGEVRSRSEKIYLKLQKNLCIKGIENAVEGKELEILDMQFKSMLKMQWLFCC